MKISVFGAAAATIAIATVFSVSVNAQRKKPSQPAPAQVATVSPLAAEVRAGSENVASELKKVVRFLYILGGVAQGIEDIDGQAKSGKAPKALVDQNEQFKKNVIQSIHNLGAGLAALEVEFRTKPGLRPYASKADGLTARVGVAEDLAVAGKFKEAGKELIGVVEQLADLLVALP